jgi:hypothetical protein
MFFPENFYYFSLLYGDEFFLDPKIQNQLFRFSLSVNAIDERNQVLATTQHLRCSSWCFPGAKEVP